MNKIAFSQLPRPIVTCILGERTVDAAVANIKNGEFQGAPAFAIHLEPLGEKNLTDENFRRIVRSTRRPVMFLHYRGTERFPTALSDEERVEVLRRAVICGASAVDITADTYNSSRLEFTDDPAAVDRQRRFIDEVHGLGAEVVVSAHTREVCSCDQVLGMMKAMEARGADFAKIVTVADTEAEFLEAVRTTMELRREMKVPFIHLCNGKFALPHRYLSPSLGNAMTFCVTEYTPDRVVPSQPPLRNMMSILGSYSWSIDDIEEE